MTFVYNPLSAVILAGILALIVTTLTSEDLDQLSPVAHPPRLHLGVRVVVKLNPILSTGKLTGSGSRPALAFP